MVNIRKRGKVYQYQFEIAKVDGKRKYISNVSKVFDNVMKSDIINNIIKYEIAY